jgi:hypothetical protein
VKHIKWPGRPHPQSTPHPWQNGIPHDQNSSNHSRVRASKQGTMGHGNSQQTQKLNQKKKASNANRHEKALASFTTTAPATY